MTHIILLCRIANKDQQQETTKNKLVEVKSQKKKLSKKVQSLSSRDVSIRKLRQERLEADACSEQIQNELDEAVVRSVNAMSNMKSNAPHIILFAHREKKMQC